MAEVTGTGGIFFRNRHPAALARWYEQHFGTSTEGTMTNFTRRHRDDPERTRYTVWAAFAEDTPHFEPWSKGFMLDSGIVRDDRDPHGLRHPPALPQGGRPSGSHRSVRIFTSGPNGFAVPRAPRLRKPDRRHRRLAQSRRSASIGSSPAARAAG